VFPEQPLLQLLRLVYPNRSEEVVAAVRQAIGDDVTLMVDANSGYTAEEYAGPVADMLARLGLCLNLHCVMLEGCVWPSQRMWG
jgi:L-alanine-DL-glutamate epimerase-like enolase superfamily enzyme